MVLESVQPTAPRASTTAPAPAPAAATAPAPALPVDAPDDRGRQDGGEQPWMDPAHRLTAARRRPRPPTERAPDGYGRRRWWRLRQATAAPTSAGRAMQNIAIRKAGEVGEEARAPATT